MGAGIEDAVKRIHAGNRRALSRAITTLESQGPEADALFDALFGLGRGAHVVGITGAPGSGKSSLVAELVTRYRSAPEPRRVGVVAVDPSSPFSGGAILGDRLRLRQSAPDPGVFYRSMASRGSLGGLARATWRVVHALDAAGYDPILVETVGAGQAEVEIMRVAHTTIVVDVPGMGDEMQALKAGILEIGQIFVVNKADRPGADRAVRNLEDVLALSPPSDEPRPPVLETIARDGEGVAQLLEAIDAHREHLDRTGARRRMDRQRVAHEMELLLRDALFERWALGPGHREALDQILEALEARETSPRRAIARLLGGD